MSHRCKIHIFHVSGDRMTEQVGDGLSIENFSEGHTKGRMIFESTPVNNNALEISPFLGEWLKSWVGEDTDILEPVGCFIRSHNLEKHPGAKETNVEGSWMLSYQSGKMIWFPAPAAAFNKIVDL